MQSRFDYIFPCCVLQSITWYYILVDNYKKNRFEINIFT